MKERKIPVARMQIGVCRPSVHDASGRDPGSNRVQLRSSDG
jgi:hypothetical protein